MAIEITEKFKVTAPLGVVWEFVTQPARVVTCMPGAKLVEQLNDDTYLGQVKVKLGAITTSYEGEVVFASVDEAAHAMQLTGEGRETGGGTAKGTVDIRLVDLGDETEMTVEAKVDLTGKVMQVGRGMIKGVSRQLFKQFAKSATEQLEAPAAGQPSANATPEGGVAPVSAATREDDQALAVVPLLARTIWDAIVGFIRRLFARLFRRDT